MKTKISFAIGSCVRIFVVTALQVSAFIATTAIAQQNNSYNWVAHDESVELQELATHQIPRMRFKLINSRFLDKNSLWESFNQELADFTLEKYEAMKPLVLEKNIPTLQRAIQDGNLSYEELVKFYLYRIRLFESNNNASLNALIAINPNVINDARSRDRAVADGLSVNDYSLFGIPVLLKDNIGTNDIPTTAGALVLLENHVPDAFVTGRLRDNGAIIFGKANLSEWAYYFCDGCPLGYSAVGGQTLNPYGRKIFETGGSSSGSAVAVAANYAPVAVGSETSGSILSPASRNGTVGLKPTTGVISRSGVVPISSSLDTLGPIAKNVTDAVILFNAMTGFDQEDVAMPMRSADAGLLFREVDLGGKRLGVITGLDSEPLFESAIALFRRAGAEIVEVDLPAFQLPAFGAFLGAEMQRDLARYLTEVADDSVNVSRVEDIISFNREDLDRRAPYGQGRFEAMLSSTNSGADIREMLETIRSTAENVLGRAFVNGQLDGVLSINNRHASLAAAANFPALTIPLGLRDSGEPVGLTLIGSSYDEQVLVDIGLAFERLQRGRVLPEDYQ